MAERFGIGSLGLGGLPGLTETMDMVRKAWSSLSIPSTLAPTMSLDELDRRIADLKAVEQWLDLNLGMLRSTIQAIEIQRGTLAALRALGRAAAEGGATAEALARAAASFAPGPAAEPRPAPAPERTTAPGSAGAPPPGVREDGEGSASATGGTSAGAEKAPDEAAGGAAAGKSAIDGLAAGLTQAATAAMNPAAWWDLLQSQFNQVAQAAISGRGLESSPPAEPPPRAARKRAAPKRGAAKAAPKKAARPPRRGG